MLVPYNETSGGSVAQNDRITLDNVTIVVYTMHGFIALGSAFFLDKTSVEKSGP